MKPILFILFLTAATAVNAQPQETIWMFGGANALNFSTTPPTPGGIPNAGGTPPAWQFERSGAVSDNSGQLLFWVKLQYNTSVGADTIPNVFTISGQKMPNGQLASNLIGAGLPLIVPIPGNPHRYYVFYIKNSGLLYAVVDMSLNNGAGDVLPGQKNLLLGNWSTLVDTKLLAVAGCNGIWIIVRKRTANEFLSYKLTDTGLVHTPVVSTVGLLPPSWYGGPAGPDSWSGVMKADETGSRIAVAANGSLVATQEKGGLELYDFEKCSGRLLNPVLLDSGSYYGTCFSPDGSKLYTTKLFERNGYQYDLSLPTTPAIVASKTLILTNPSYGVIFPDWHLLGDLKAGNDGKIYAGNNSCHPPNPNALHIIEQPNLPGLACQPVINGLLFPTSGECTGLNLPLDIVTALAQDTIYGPTRYLSACFRDSLLLQSTAAGSCFSWNDTMPGRELMVYQQGNYILKYTGSNCTMHIDTFKVTFPQLPSLYTTGYSCPGRQQARAWVLPASGDTSLFSYHWKDASGNLLQTTTSATGDTLHQLNPGDYRLHISTVTGCDTFLEFTIAPLPVPVASFVMPDTICKGDTILFTNTSPAPLWTWLFDGATIVKEKNPRRVYPAAGTHTSLVAVTNIEGCSDTAEQQFTVRELKLQLTADKASFARGETVYFQTISDVSFAVTAWQPATLFAQQHATSQLTVLDTTRTITVSARSGYGCMDTASIVVYIKPLIMMPSAFSPNGDGLNDLFRPWTWGEPVIIRYFEVYNRWGQAVYKSQGKSTTGWDGSFNGQSAEVGTYFYLIEIETPDRKTHTQKGDVILTR